MPGARWHWRAPGFFLLTFGLCACLQAASPSAEETARFVANLDRTVWPRELQAREHEHVFVKLADRVRAQTNKIAALAGFSFERMRVPRPEGEPAKLDWGIHHQRFSRTNSLVIAHSQWPHVLAQFERAGWVLDQVEWTHENFHPTTPGQPTWSGIAFELHGQQPACTNRFMVRGVMRVHWAADSAPGELKRPAEIVLTALDLFERSGRPAFNNHLLVAPEPDQPNGAINLNPLIVADLDGNHADDIVLPGVNSVLLNDGKVVFRKVPLLTKAHFHGNQEAGLLADLDGDGWLDFIGVPAGGPWANKLVFYPGDGQLPFERTPRVACGNLRLQQPSVITAGDIDRDGDLDLWLAQYKPPYIGGQVPTPYYDCNDGYSSFLLLNDGAGRFAQAIASAGLNAKRFRRTLAASFADLDGDNDLDLLALNDYSGVDLYDNDGAGKFSDQSSQFDNRHLFGMSHSLGDFDGDGALDILAIGMSITSVRRLDAMGLRPDIFPDRTARRGDMGYGNRLYVRRQDRWTQPEFAPQLARTGWSWGVAAFDFDNDRDLDIYIANGHVSGRSSEDYCSQFWTHDIYVGGSREDAQMVRYFAGPLRGLNQGDTSWNGYQHNVFFVDLGANNYLNVAYLMGVAHETDCRSVVSADLNNDGRRDLLVEEALWVGGPNLMRHRLLVHLNQLPTAHHWLGVRLSSSQASGTPIGAKITVVTPERVFPAQIVTGDSFQAQSPFAAHFGLGQATNVTAIHVQWPSGRKITLDTPAVDRWHVVR